MLVVTRKKGELLHIGDDITVVITKIEGGRVGVGIEAPPEILIQRKEVADRAKQRDSTQPELNTELTRA